MKSPTSTLDGQRFPGARAVIPLCGLPLLAAACGGADPADDAALDEALTAVTPIPTSNPILGTERNVVFADLARHTPAARSRSRTTLFPLHTTKSMTVMAWTRQGLSTRTFDSDGRKWTNWVHLGNPTAAPLAAMDQYYLQPGLDTTLVLAPALAAGKETTAFFGFRTTSPLTGAGDVSTAGALSFSSTAATVPPAVPGGPAYMNAVTGFNVLAGNVWTQHVFGTALPWRLQEQAYLASFPLTEERRGASGAVTFVDHGLPPGALNVVVGPSGAASVVHEAVRNGVATNETHYYVVAGVDQSSGGSQGPQNGPEIVARHSLDTRSWTWESLGSPANQTFGAPATAVYYDAVPAGGGKGHLYVFAVAHDGSDWTTFVRHHDGLGWGGWQNLGRPSGLPGGARYELTTTQVWWDGAQYDPAALRVEVFGYSRPRDGRAGMLVHLRGQGGSFGTPQAVAAPDGQDVRLTSSAAIDFAGYDRVSAFLRTGTGRIYEYVLETSWSSFVFSDLSFEPFVVQRRQIGP